MIETNPDYWDCECETQYIHKKTDSNECKECSTTDEYQPDSHVGEVDLLIPR